jgi:hypothetical protein
MSKVEQIYSTIKYSAMSTPHGIPVVEELISLATINLRDGPAFRAQSRVGTKLESP